MFDNLRVITPIGINRCFMWSIRICHEDTKRNIWVDYLTINSSSIRLRITIRNYWKYMLHSNQYFGNCYQNNPFISSGTSKLPLRDRHHKHTDSFKELWLDYKFSIYIKLILLAHFCFRKVVLDHYEVYASYCPHIVSEPLCI
jgi:hypothetical protein